MTTEEAVWGGPLFYPPVDMIAVLHSGARVQVWPNECESDGCFTGLMLSGGNSAWRVVHDLSVLWLRYAIDHIEAPTDADRGLFI